MNRDYIIQCTTENVKVAILKTGTRANTVAQVQRIFKRRCSEIAIKS